MEKYSNKNSKEKILQNIVLKYYVKPKKSSKDKPSGITCSVCRAKNIVNIGGGFYDKKGNLKQICEECAVWRYKYDYGFRTLKTAKARRRRLFDVGYLFNEMVLDRYMELGGIKDFKDLDGEVGNKVFIESINLYNYLFSKEDKIRIEEIENQKNIEDELRKRFNLIDFKEYFKEKGF